MILIGGEIIESLKKTVFTVPGVDVKDAYSIGRLKCPLIAIDERPGNEGIYIDNQPAVVQNIIIIEAYTKDISAPRTMNRKNVAYSLISEIDSLLNKKFGLTMTGNIQAAPYDDETIFRAVTRYIAYIDTRTGLIYRKI